VITAEELLERILILTTVNSTLLHALISIEAEADVSPKQIRHLAHGVRAVHDSVKQALPNSTDEKSGDSFVDDTIQVILTHLERIEDALGKLAESREAKAIPEGVLAEPESTAVTREPVRETAKDLEDLTGRPFQRRLSIHDPERLLSPIEQLLDKYSRRSHLLLPMFWFEACRELFRYSEPKNVITSATRIASKAFHDMVRRLLSEAPSAGLLQGLTRKGIGGEELTTTEKNKIITDAREFYTRLAASLKSGSASEAVAKAKRSLQTFDWGPVDIEKRVVGMFHRGANELAENASDGQGLSPEDRIIAAELSRYMCVLSASVLGLPRFRQLLAEMKA
jgi:hypothetical protein